MRRYSFGARPSIRDARGTVLTGEAVAAAMDRGEIDELIAAGIRAEAKKKGKP